MSQTHTVQHRTIDAEEAGQRIDNYLIRTLAHVPKTRLYRAIRKGEVRVNKGRIKPTYKLKAGDSVRIPPLGDAGDAQPKNLKIKLKKVPQPPVYEDKNLMVVDKPSGMAVHGGSGLNFGLIDLLRNHYDLPYLELAHRLDRDTSGCLMLAKRRSTLRVCHQLLREGLIEKRYVALLQGRLSKRRKVTAPLRKFIKQGGERIVKVDPDHGKPAETRFIPIQNFEQATLVEVELLTGRTHQIRVHAQHIGHPIAGDPKYGDDDFNQYMQSLGLKRLFLHAELLAWQLPEHPPRQARAPLPKALTEPLAKLAT